MAATADHVEAGPQRFLSARVIRYRCHVVPEPNSNGGDRPSRSSLGCVFSSRSSGSGGATTSSFLCLGERTVLTVSSALIAAAGQRGLAMGIRQTAQPLGIALGALVMPELAENDSIAARMFPAVWCAIAAVVSAIGIIDAPRKRRQSASSEELAKPYRGSSVLWRIHAVSALTRSSTAVWRCLPHGRGETHCAAVIC